uniref:Uncharacterized protein n=1 Tax=Elaeophora elaphi TaxID=1147741 RepID=A0A0R3S682_9BILA
MNMERFMYDSSQIWPRDQYSLCDCRMFDREFHLFLSVN